MVVLGVGGGYMRHGVTTPASILPVFSPGLCDLLNFAGKAAAVVRDCYCQPCVACQASLLLGRSHTFDYLTTSIPEKDDTLPFSEFIFARFGMYLGRQL